MYALVNCILHCGHQTLREHALIISDDRIESIVPVSSLDDSIEQIDLQGQQVSAGFIDLQLNGCGGVMLNADISVATLQTMQQANLKSGTTSYLPTLITSSDEDMRKAISVTRDYLSDQPNQVLGLHLEGPYINVEKKGIHNPEYIRPSDPGMIEHICDNADVISMLTLAPEKVPAEHIGKLRDAGIMVSAGHSNATYQQAVSGFNAGIGFSTHLFNAMSAIGSGREPGLVGAVYDSPEIYAGIIVDGHHVHYANVRIAHQMKQQKLCLVTDAAAPAGAPAGFDHFDFVGSTIYFRDGQCVDNNGTLGGSALTMIEGIQNLVEQVGLPMDEAIRMATLYPAQAIGVDDRLGSVEPGKIANLTVFDANFRVDATIVNGKMNRH
ncbi:N-acetylglucosamine-6-phosphate deacetylase [Dongshaea marina]|uniref:N-acetylglucosamine-6-phosphate deacetylase n=1 Tax=Dongshaea marina TaxID=2047966 RepID=UPI000D3E19C4|nr:N-acetylglucosamine-6-phosphate deacetylase [Dongshaea marina]